MNKFVLATLSFTAGAAIGFVVGHFVQIEKEVAQEEAAKRVEEEQKELEKIIKENKYVDPAELERPSDDDPSSLLSKGPAHIAMPGQSGVNYAKVQEIVKEQNITDPEEIQQVVEDPANEETYEDRVERERIEETEELNEYRKKNAGKIVPIQKDEWDSDFRDVDYDKKDLYYFVTDDVLTDEDGNHVNEEEYIGSKPRQFGWMANDEERIYIRNNPKETDFQVWKERCASEDWWA